MTGEVMMIGCVVVVGGLTIGGRQLDALMTDVEMRGAETTACVMIAVDVMIRAARRSLAVAVDGRSRRGGASIVAVSSGIVSTGGRH